jgi:hypothetical protein
MHLHPSAILVSRIAARVLVKTSSVQNRDGVTRMTGLVVMTVVEMSLAGPKVVSSLAVNVTAVVKMALVVKTELVAIATTRMLASAATRLVATARDSLRALATLHVADNTTLLPFAGRFADRELNIFH